MASFFGSHFVFVCLAAIAIAATAPLQPYYIITNAETPSLNRAGLTPVGQARAESCIPPIFSQLNIGFILSCSANSLGCAAANETAMPLAQALGLNITLSTTGSVKSKVNAFLKASATNQSALVVWNASEMEDLFDDADVNDDGIDDDSLAIHPDVILTVVNGKRTGQTSMNCTGVDGEA
ncbi:hypothetical protein C8R45DRAFT_1039958 [Mycena sanguinolenta]|nr:hypothetical protein C8R45DRAFT_1039958 [Mycena sanguinolenta]